MTIRPNIKAALDHYVANGTPTSGFLQAVLSNDLFGAMYRADYHNRETLNDIVHYIVTELPADCYGSPDQYKIWLKEKRHDA